MMTDARGFIRDLLQFVEVAPSALAEVLTALDLPMKDLEDAMQVSAASSYGASSLITRNIGDYQRSPIPAVSPDKFLKQLAVQK